MFTGYFFLFFLNIYAILGVISQFQEYSSTSLIIEFELGKVAKQNSDQNQVCVTSSGKGKKTTKVTKLEEGSYLGWSCNKLVNHESNNSASTATTGTTTLANGIVTKIDETKTKPKPTIFSFSSKSKMKEKFRNKSKKDIDGINTKLLPKVVVTHVIDVEASNLLQDQATSLNVEHAEKTQNFSTKCQTMIGPTKTSGSTKYVISKINGSMVKEEKCLGNVENRKKHGSKGLYHVRANSIPKSKKSKHVNDALKKHCHQKSKLDAIEEASVELLSSSVVAVSYSFANVNEYDNVCDEKTSKMTEMHTIGEANGVISDLRGGSSSTNSGNETMTSNSSEVASDPFETVYHQSRSSSLPASSKDKVTQSNTNGDEKDRTTSSCGKLPSNHCYDCENSNHSEKYINGQVDALESPIINEDCNGMTPLIMNEVNI